MSDKSESVASIMKKHFFVLSNVKSPDGKMETKFKCLQCETTLTTKNSSTSLLRHIQSLHVDSLTLKGFGHLRRHQEKEEDDVIYVETETSSPVPRSQSNILNTPKIISSSRSTSETYKSTSTAVTPKKQKINLQITITCPCFYCTIEYSCMSQHAHKFYSL